MPKSKKPVNAPKAKKSAAKVGAQPSVKEQFKQFLEKLHVEQPHLSENEIVQKMVQWVEARSDDQAAQLKIVNKIALLMHPDQMSNSLSAELRTYLQAAVSDGKLDVYFKRLRASFEPITKNDPKTLESFYAFLYQVRMIEIQPGSSSKNTSYTPNLLYKIVLAWINDPANGFDTPEAKRLIARQIVRHFGLSEEEIRKTSPFNITDLNLNPANEDDALLLEKSNKEKIAIALFRGAVSYNEKEFFDKNFRIYFKNLEHEIVPPEGFFASLRFKYHKQIARVLRIVKNNFWDAMQRAAIITGCVVFVFSAFMVYGFISHFGLALALSNFVALATLETLQFMLTFTGYAYALSFPFAMASFHSDSGELGEMLGDAYVGPILMVVAAPFIEIPALLVDIGSAIQRRFTNSTQEVPVEEAQAQKQEKPAAKPKGRKKAAKSSTPPPAQAPEVPPANGNENVSEPDSEQEQEQEKEPGQKKARSPKPGKNGSDADALD